jgi:hypothetical protein
MGIINPLNNLINILGGIMKKSFLLILLIPILSLAQQSKFNGITLTKVDQSKFNGITLTKVDSISRTMTTAQAYTDSVKGFYLTDVKIQMLAQDAANFEKGNLLSSSVAILATNINQTEFEFLLSLKRLLENSVAKDGRTRIILDKDQFENLLAQANLWLSEKKLKQSTK